MGSDQQMSQAPDDHFPTHEGPGPSPDRPAREAPLDTPEDRPPLPPNARGVPDGSRLGRRVTRPLPFTRGPSTAPLPTQPSPLVPPATVDRGRGSRTTRVKRHLFVEPRRTVGRSATVVAETLHK